MIASTNGVSLMQVLVKTVQGLVFKETFDGIDEDYVTANIMFVNGQPVRCGTYCPIRFN